MPYDRALVIFPKNEAELTKVTDKLMAVGIECTEMPANLANYAHELRARLKEATGYCAHEFTSDEPVGGAGLVEWFAEWRQKAADTLTRTK